MVCMIMLFWMNSMMVLVKFLIFFGVCNGSSRLVRLNSSRVINAVVMVTMLILLKLVKRFF